jgi:hypothetical protein
VHVMIVRHSWLFYSSPSFLHPSLYNLLTPGRVAMETSEQ